MTNQLLWYVFCEIFFRNADCSFWWTFHICVVAPHGHSQYRTTMNWIQLFIEQQRKFFLLMLHCKFSQEWKFIVIHKIGTFTLWLCVITTGCTSQSRCFASCVLMFHCLNVTALSYLADCICLVADVDGRRYLRSSATASLIVLPVRRSTLVDQCRRSMGMEQSAVSYIFTHHLPMRTENISFSLEFSGPLVTNSLFPPTCFIPLPNWPCKVPLQYSASVSLK